MREEISEPQHWRAQEPIRSQCNQSWTSRRRSQDRAELTTEARDAAFSEVASEVATEAPAKKQLNTTDIVSSLASQLDLLEKQREQLQRLLEQAQAKS